MIKARDTITLTRVNDGAAGKGIKLTAIAYQTSNSATKVPTGTWTTTIPATDVNKPYLWTRTTHTYTDNTVSTSYSVSSTLDSVDVGGRNLLRNSAYEYYKFSKKYNNGFINTGADTLTYFRFTFGFYKDSTLIKEPIVNYAIKETGHYALQVRNVSDTVSNRIRIKHNGGSNGVILYNVLSEPIIKDQTYTISFDVIGFNPSVVGGLIVDNIKLEKGNVATDWTPAPEDQVDKGDVVNQTNAELKIAGNVLSLTGGHVTIDSKNMTLDKNGNATFSGELKAAKGTFAGEVRAKSITIESTDVSTAQNAGISTQMTVSGDSFNVLQNYDSENPSGTSGKSWQQSVIGIQANPDQLDEKEVLMQTEDRLLSSGGTVTSGGKNNIRVNLNGVEVNAKYVPVTIKSGDKINLNADSGVFVNGKDVTDTFEPKIVRSNAGVYYKEGYQCCLHAWWAKATDVFFTVSESYRPKKMTTCIGFCMRNDDARAYPLMCELETSGAWQVWAMTGIGVSGGEGLWVVYQPANGIDHRSEFTVCVTGSWLTSSNGSK